MTVARPKPARNRTAKNRPAAGHAPRTLVLTTALAFVLSMALLAWELSEPWRTATPSAGGVKVRVCNVGTTALNGIITVRFLIT